MGWRIVIRCELVRAASNRRHSRAGAFENAPSSWQSSGEKKKGASQSGPTAGFPLVVEIGWMTGGGPPGSQNADRDSGATLGVLEIPFFGPSLQMEENPKGRPILPGPAPAAGEMKRPWLPVVPCGGNLAAAAGQRPECSSILKCPKQAFSPQLNVARSIVDCAYPRTRLLSAAEAGAGSKAPSRCASQSRSGGRT